MSLAALFLIVQFVDWTEENTSDARFNRIELGMTMKEVQDILGRPSLGPSAETAGTVVLLWDIPDEGNYFVRFDPDGRATTKGWWEHYSKPKRGLKDLISDWLKKLGL
jgi:hypothetical protein